MNETYEVAVIGSGAVGLSTALSIQKAFPHFNVTIFADKFDENTLSAGAGGLFRPEINVHPDSKRVKKWCKDSFLHYHKILSSSEAPEAGMQLISGYHMSSTSAHPKSKFLQGIVPQYHVLEDKELQTGLFPDRFKKGVFYTTIITDCRYYLPWMKSKFEKAGGKVVMKHISSLEEIPDRYSIIVNCTGLMAKQLVADDQLIPVRGQTIRVKAPWIKHFYYGDDVYVIPGVDFVTLGGVKDYGSWSLEVNKYQKQYIWDKCTELVPSLKKAEIVTDWVGLRPHRPSVRVEAEFVPHNGKYRMVVHNYGHSGHGITLSWGTAQDVTEIIKDFLSKKPFHLSKL